MSNTKTEIVWYCQLRQWAWLAMAAATFAAGIALLVIRHQRHLLDQGYTSALKRVAQAKNTNAQLSADITEYDDLLDSYAQQKDRLIQQVADFSNQLDILNRKTRSVERARDELVGLNSAFVRFQTAEQMFNRNLESLEMKIKEGAKGPQP